jgi:putative membrane protein
MRRAGLLWIAAVILAGGCSKTAGTKPPSSERPAGGTAAVATSGTVAISDSDRDFVHDVAMMNMAEVELSRMALERALSSDIKAFAQRMIDDHSAAGTKLKDAVTGQPIEWPAQLDDKHRKTADELRTQQGVEFDRAYLKAMVYGHQDLGAKLESRLDLQSLADWKTAAAGRTQSKALPEPTVALRDVEIRPEKSDTEIGTKINQWAADTYPVAQKHLDTARTLEKAARKRSTN